MGRPKQPTPSRLPVPSPSYVTTRDFAANPETGTAGDLGPEGLLFVPAAQSPNHRDLLIVSYEISGSVRIFQVKK